MQIKTIMRYHYTPIRMVKIQNTDNINAGEDELGVTEPTFIACGNAKGYSHFGRHFGMF